MKKLLYTILALMAVACGSKPQTTEISSISPKDSLLVAEFYKTYIQSKFGNDSTAIQQFIRQETESLDSCYLIHYKQLINGYDIRMGVKGKYPLYEGVECYGNMIISNGEKAICDTFMIYLADSVYHGLTTHRINELDYRETYSDYYDTKYPCLWQFGEMPVVVFDIDFDGEKEMLLRVSEEGQRGRNCYHPIVLTWDSPCGWIPDNDFIYNGDISLENYLYFPLDDMTQFDCANKTFILHLSAGWWSNEWHYYKVENGESRLVKKIVEYDRNAPKVKRITYHGNDSTVTNIAVGKDNSYSID